MIEHVILILQSTEAHPQRNERIVKKLQSEVGTKHWFGGLLSIYREHTRGLTGSFVQGVTGHPFQSCKSVQPSCHSSLGRPEPFLISLLPESPMFKGTGNPGAKPFDLRTPCQRPSYPARRRPQGCPPASWLRCFPEKGSLRRKSQPVDRRSRKAPARLGDTMAIEEDV